MSSPESEVKAAAAQVAGTVKSWWAGNAKIVIAIAVACFAIGAFIGHKL